MLCVAKIKNEQIALPGDYFQRMGLGSAPKRSQTTTWKDFIRSHMDVLAGTDFFTVEVLTWRGLVTYYGLFFIHLESRRVSIAGITSHPHEYWMQQIARNATMEEWGSLNRCRYVLHDRDTKFCASFRDILAAGGVQPLALPARSPNLNAFAERSESNCRLELCCGRYRKCAEVRGQVPQRKSSPIVEVMTRLAPDCCESPEDR